MRDERLRTCPSAGVNLGYQFKAFQKLTGSYQFRYDDFAEDEQTRPDFLGPIEHRDQRRGAGLRIQADGILPAAADAFAIGAGQWESWGTRRRVRSADQQLPEATAQPGQGLLLGGLHKVHTQRRLFGGAELDRF